MKLLREMYPDKENYSLLSLLQKCRNNLTDALDQLMKEASSKNKKERSVEEEWATTVDRKRKLNGEEATDSPQKVC